MRPAVLVVLGSLLAAPAQAGEVSYDYLELTRVSADREGVVGGEGKGLRLAGMLSVAGNWHALAEYTDLTLDYGAPFGDLEHSVWRLGGGYHAELAEGIDGLAEISLDQIDAGRTTTGLGLRFGLSGMATDHLELTGHVRYTSADDVRSADAMLGVGAAWRVSDEFALSFAYESGDLSRLQFGLRVTL